MISFGACQSGATRRLGALIGAVVDEKLGDPRKLVPAKGLEPLTP